MLLSLHFLCVPFLDCLQYVCVFVLYLWAQRWTQISLTGPEQRGRVTSLDWLLMLFLMQSRKQWESNRLLCCTGTLWAHNPPNVQHDTTNLFFFMTFSSQSALSLYQPWSQMQYLWFVFSVLKFLSTHFSSLLNGNTGMWCMNLSSQLHIIYNFAEGLLCPNPRPLWRYCPVLVLLSTSWVLCYWLASSWASWRWSQSFELCSSATFKFISLSDYLVCISSIYQGG